MQLVMRNGEIKEVDTSFMFNNRYITTDGERVYDVNVHHIIDDIRLEEFYCGGGKQGTYDEVAKAIAEKREKINKCDSCFWFHKHTRIDNECHKEEIREGNKKIIREQTVYELSCDWQSRLDKKCVHDIDDMPKLFREATDCFFCKYPKGIADMKPLKQFMIDNADKYGIVPYWSDQELSINNSFIHKKTFGSYKFKASHWGDYFELENARNRFKFYIDFANKQFILNGGIGYTVVKQLTEHKCEYDYKTKQHKSYDKPITNYEKFATWFWQIVDDFMEAQNENPQSNS